MSIRVLIVDDEKLERVLIRKGFNWEENGFVIVGEAASGEEALLLVEQEKPDLVLTDISMVNMNGLELSERILKGFPSTSIVIITGYREFEYARRAVKIGVEDFLLKPVSIADLSLVALKIKEKIVKEREEKEEVIQLKESVLADQSIVMESFFHKLIEGEILEEEAKRRLNMFGFQVLADGYVLLNIRLKEKSEIRSMKKVKEVMAIIEEEVRSEHMTFTHYQQSIMVLLSTQSRTASWNLAERIHTRIEDEVGTGSTIGISDRHEEVRNIPLAFKESEMALSASVLLGRNRCITYKEYQGIISQNQHKKDIDWEDFIFSIENGLMEKVSEHVAQYVMLIQGSKITDIEYYRLMTMDMLSKGATTLNQYGSGLNQISGEDDLYREIRSISTVDEMEPYLLKSLGKIMAFHQRKKSRRGRKVVEDALQHVDQFIFSPDLSLKTVAAAIYSNESYLSRVFKKEMGISLIEYILKKRIEESIRLLNTTDMKVYEVAEKIGFRDAHYFSICFKKITGVTVKEFRKLKVDSHENNHVKV